MKQPRITAFAGVEGLARLEEDWRRLLREMPDPAFHQAFEVHMAYAVHCQDADTAPMYLALSDGGSIRGICPLERGTDRLLGRKRRVWRLPLSRIGLHCDVVCPPDQDVRNAFLAAIVEFLQHAPDRRGWLLLDRIPDTSGAWHCVQAYASRRVHAEDLHPMHVIDTTPSYDVMVAARTRQHRTNLRKARKRLAAHANVHFERFADPAAVQRELEVFLTLEAAGWKGAQRTAAVFRPYLAGFLRDIARMRNDIAQSEMNALYVGDQCLASQLCFHSGAEYVSYKIAYDERFSQLSPGQVLMDWILERCCENPAIDRVNLISDADWHLPWNPTVARVHSAYVALGRLSGPAVAALLRFRQRGKGYREPTASGSST